MIEKNVFNITKLRHTDQGKYYCKADCAGKEKYAGEIFVNKGKLEPKVCPTPCRPLFLSLYFRPLPSSLQGCMHGKCLRYTEDVDAVFTKKIVRIRC